MRDGVHNEFHNASMMPPLKSLCLAMFYLHLQHIYVQRWPRSAYAFTAPRIWASTAVARVCWRSWGEALMRDGVL